MNYQPSSALLKIAIIQSRFNSEITDGLLQGALHVLKNAKKQADYIHWDHLSAPGAFEIPLMAKRLALSGDYHGIITLGCVIKGDTAHFEYICESVVHGLMSVQLETLVPVTLGIITTYTEEQALVRSRDDEHNKGREAALALMDVLTQEINAL